jgi:hypothetical protein
MAEKALGERTWEDLNLPERVIEILVAVPLIIIPEQKSD